jgi:hypothetical protein
LTYLPWSQLANVDEVAETFYLAPSFGSDQVILDPTGHLGRLRDAIAPGFAHPAAVRRRCDNAIARLDNGLRAIDPAAPSTLVILIAALRNPTVRLRYLAARGVLHDHNLDDLYLTLLTLLGCADRDRQTVTDRP